MKVKSNKILKGISLFLCLLLCFQQAGFSEMAVSLNIASHLSSLHSSLVSESFRPLHLRYLSFNPLDNSFKLLLDKGSLKNPSTQEIESTSKTLMQYFLIGLTLPNDTFWVNLRPDSPDQIIDDRLAQTDIGRIMLETDLQLKKDTASFTSPQTPEGREYWDKLYKKAEELYGTDNVTIPTLTRPWIVPGEIIIRETSDSAYIYKATLKVMLEQDYLKNTQNAITSSVDYTFKDQRSKALNEYSTQLIRELIIPKLIKEVNSSKRYASLRQVYYSLIMAQWFKARFKGKQGAYYDRIDSQNLTNLASKEDWSKTTYFKEYQKSFKDGEYNIKEPIYTPTGQVIRNYFSGGEVLGAASSVMKLIPTGVSSSITRFTSRTVPWLLAITLSSSYLFGTTTNTIVSLKEQQQVQSAQPSNIKNDGNGTHAYNQKIIDEYWEKLSKEKYVNKFFRNGIALVLAYVQNAKLNLSTDSLMSALMSPDEMVSRSAGICLAILADSLPINDSHKQLFSIFRERIRDIVGTLGYDEVNNVHYEFSPRNAFLIYQSKSFLTHTKGFDKEFQFSLATGVEDILVRFQKNINDENIRIVLPYILEAWKEFSSKVLLHKKSNVIETRHAEFSNDFNFVMEYLKIDTGNKKVLRRFEGSNDAKRLKKTKDGLRKAIRSPYFNTLFMQHHGEKNHLWLNPKEVQNYDDLNLPNAYSYKEFAEDLLQRAKNNKGRLSDFTIFISSCDSGGFNENTQRELVAYFLRGEIKDFPTIITSTHRGASGRSMLLDISRMMHYKSNLLDSDKSLGSVELRGSDIQELIRRGWKNQHISFTLSLSENKWRALAKALNEANDDSAFPEQGKGTLKKNTPLNPKLPVMIVLNSGDDSTATVSLLKDEPSAASSAVKTEPLISELPGIVTNGGRDYWDRWDPEKVRNYTLDEYIQKMVESSGHFAVRAGFYNVPEEGFFVSPYIAKMVKDKRSPMRAFPSRAVHFSIDQAYYKDGRSMALVCSLEALMENKAFLDSPFKESNGEFIPTGDFPCTGFHNDPLDISHRFDINELGILFVPNDKELIRSIASLKHPPRRIYIYSEDTLGDAINNLRNKLNFKEEIILSGKVVAAREDNKSNDVGGGRGRWLAVGGENNSWSPYLKGHKRERSYNPEELCQMAENLTRSESGKGIGLAADDYANLLLDEAISANPGLAKAYLLKGKIAYDDDTRKAYFEKALLMYSHKISNQENLGRGKEELAPSEAELWGELYESLGSIYRERLVLDRAMQYFRQADKIYSEFGIQSNIKGAIAYTRALVEARRRVKKTQSFSELKVILSSESLLTISPGYKESLLTLLRRLDSGKYITNILLKYSLEEAQGVVQKFTDIEKSDQADKNLAVRELTQIDDYVRGIINIILGGDLGKTNYDIIERRQDEFFKEISLLKRVIEEDRNSPLTTTANPAASSPLGGIDFRFLPIITQAVTNLSANISNSAVSRLSSINLDEEWSSIEKMASSGIKPSTERIKEYAQASSVLGKISQDKDKIIVCVSYILRQEEDSYCETDPVLRDILVVLESIEQPQELKEAFLGKTA